MDEIRLSRGKNKILGATYYSITPYRINSEEERRVDLIQILINNLFDEGIFRIQN